MDLILYREQKDSAVQQCLMPKNSGAGSNHLIKMFYFDSQTKKCESFYYNGVKGNLNRFNTVENCEKECLEINHVNYITEVVVIIIVIIIVVIGVIVAYKYAKYYQTQINYRIFQNQAARQGSIAGSVSDLAYENPIFEGNSNESARNSQNIQLSEQQHAN